MSWSPVYATLAEYKAFLRIDTADSADDAQLTADLEAASRAIDFHTNRQFGIVAAPEVRYYTPRWDIRANRYVVHIDDLMTVTGAVVLLDTTGDLSYPTTVDLTKSQLTPLNAAPKGVPWIRLVLPLNTSVPQTDGAVKMTASWGWTAVPVTVKDACLIQANRFTKRRDSPFGIAGSPDLGNELRLLQKLDVDVINMLRRYVRIWIGV